MRDNEIGHLLAEIRDIQRQHLEEYRRVTEEALELQRRAVQWQEHYGRLYKRVLFAGGIVLLALMYFLIAPLFLGR